MESLEDNQELLEIFWDLDFKSLADEIESRHGVAAVEVEAARPVESAAEWSELAAQTAGAVHVAAIGDGYVAAGDNLANLLAREGNIDEAIRRHAGSAALEPVRAQAWAYAGDLLRAEGRVEDARAAYRRAIEVDPAHEAAREGLDTLPGRP